MKIKKLLALVLPFLLLFSCSSSDRQIIDDSGNSKVGYDGIKIESVEIINIYNPNESGSSTDETYEGRSSYLRFDVTYKNTGDYVSDNVKFEYNVKNDIGEDFYTKENKFIVSDNVLYPGDTCTFSVKTTSYGMNGTFSPSYKDKYQVTISVAEAYYFPSAKIYSTDDGSIKISNLRFVKVGTMDETVYGTLYNYRADYDCSFELPGKYSSEALSYVSVFFTVYGSDKEYGVSLADYDEDVYLGSNSSLYFNTDVEINATTTTMHMKGILTYSRSNEKAKKIAKTTLIFVICFTAIPLISLIALVVIIIVGLNKKPKNS